MSAHNDGLCDDCRKGEHKNHQPRFAGICVGCACTQRAALKTTHTPGPWHRGGISTPGVSEPYTTIYGPIALGNQSGPMVAAEVPLRDAALIAAAPELLAALEALVAGIEDAGPIACGACINPHTAYAGNTNCTHANEVNTRVQRARGVIAKAGGKS